MEHTRRSVSLVSVFVALLCTLVLVAAPAAYGSYTVSGELSVDDEQEVVIGEEGEVVYFSFTPEESGSYTIESSGSCDTWAYLYDTEWEELAEDDDSGNNYNASITYSFEANSTYYVSFGLWNNETGTFYISVSEAEDTEAEDTEAEKTTAVAVTLDEAAEFSGAEDEDVYVQFTAPVDGYYTFRLSTDHDVSISTVYDENLSYLSRTWEWDGSVTVELSEGDVCYVLVYFWDEGEASVSVAQTTPISSATITLVDGDTYTYTGEAIEPAVTVEYDGVTLEEGTDYTLYYTTDQIGTCYVYVVGQGNYSGVVEVEYTVVPDDDSLTALTVDETYEASATLDEDSYYGETYYLLTIEDAGWYKFSLSGDFYVYAYIVDSSFSSYYASADASADDSYTQTVYFKTGTYYVVAEYWSSGDYSILVASSDFDAIAISVDTEYTVSSDSDSYYTYYTFTPSESGYYAVTLTASGSDSYYSVHAYLADDSWSESDYLAGMFDSADGDFSYENSCDCYFEADVTYNILLYNLSNSDVAVTLKVSATETDDTETDETVEYSIVSGDAQTLCPGQALVVTASGDANDLVELLIDGESLDSSCYSIEAGSTIATVSANYLDGLDDGDHDLKFVYEDGSVTAEFTLQNHDYDSVTVDPTCTEDGYTLYTCENCGDEYKDDYVDATGHSYVAVETVDPTCTEEGYTVYECENCGDKYTGDYVDATGHSYVVSETVDPTCTDDGYVVYVCENDSSHTYTETTSATGHSYAAVETVSPTCTDDGYVIYICENDSSHTYTETVAATGHTWDDGTVTTEPTHTENGVITYTCIVCGATYTSEVAALGHTWDEGTVTVEATCTTDGTKVYTCTDDDGGTYTETIPATGHTWDEGVVTTAATCEETGVTTYTCTVCGATYTSEIAATGHSWDDGVVTTEATATSDGVLTYTCQNDSSHTKTVVIPATGETSSDSTDDASDGTTNDEATTADLTAAIESAKATIEAVKNSGYTSASFTSALSVYEAAVEEAEAVLADEDATSEQIASAIASIEEAQAILEVVIAAEDAVESAAELDEGDYTAESWAAYEEAVATLEELVTSGTATSEEIAEATAAVEAAAAALVDADGTEVTADDATDADDDDGASDDSGDASDDSSDDGTSDDGGDASDDTSDDGDDEAAEEDTESLAATGDSTVAGVALVAMLGCAAAVAGVSVRKRREH